MAGGDKKTRQQLIDVIASLILGSARSPQATRDELIRRAIRLVAKEGGVFGTIRHETEVSLKPTDANTIAGWIREGRKPHNPNAFIFVLSKLGEGAVGQVQREAFRNHLGNLANILGTSLKDAEGWLSFGSTSKASKLTPNKFATIRIRTGLTQLSAELPFEEVEGRIGVTAA